MLERFNLSLALLGCIFIGSVSAQAELKFRADSLTLQAMATDTQASGAYELQNTGTQAVRITKISTSCPSCTSAVALKTVIAPGEKTEIKTVYRLANADDVKDKQIIVQTDDGAKPKILTLKIYVNEAIHFEPRRAIWKSAENRDAKTIEAQVLTDEPISEIHVSTSSGAITAECVPQKEKGKYLIKVTPGAGSPAVAWIRVEAKLKSGSNKSGTFFASAQ